MLQLTFDERLPAIVPDTVPVYAAAPVPAAGQEIQRIAHAWPGATGRGKVRSAGEWTAAAFGDVRIVHYAPSGAVHVHVRGARSRAARARERFTVEDPDATKIARAFVESARLVGQDAATLRVGKVTHLFRQIAPIEGTMGPVQTLDAGVVFRRTIDDLPVVGPGGQVMVNVLADRTVGGAFRMFRGRGSRIQTVRTIRPADAVAEFERRLRTRRRLDEDVRVMRASFGYFEAGRSQSQRFFEPVYAFVYATGGPEPLKSTEVVAGSQAPRERWWLEGPPVA